MIHLISLRLRACSILFIIISLTCFAPPMTYGQEFTVATDELDPVYRGDLQWADLDGDADVDLIYNGFEVTRVFENVNGTLQRRETTLPNIRNGSFAVGDYDNDGDNDILIAGLTTESYMDLAHLYRNDGAFNFSLVDSSFEVVANPSVEMVDLDNDNDLDFVITGATTDLMGMRFDAYRNDGGWFSNLGSILPACGQCSMDWADVNGDGLKDVVMLGFSETYLGLTQLYLNQGGYTFANDPTFSPLQLFNGVVTFGDYDNDGDLDVLQSGMDGGDGFAKTNIIENEGTGWTNTSQMLTGVGENFPSGTAWADLNNDGLQDVVLSGRGGSFVEPQFVFDVFINNGDKTFSNLTSAAFTKVVDSAVGIADYDSDGDLDIAATGYSTNGPVTKLYINQSTNQSNAKPTGSDIYIILQEGQSYTAQESDFTTGFADEDEGDALQQIAIATLPNAGTLTLNGLAVEEGQIIPVAQLAGLVYTPSPADADTVSFDFYYNDGKDNAEHTNAVVVVILPSPHAPVLSLVNDISLTMPTPISPIMFTVEDDEHDVDSLTLSATSSNQLVIPDNHLQITGTGSARTLRIKPGHHQEGQTTITIYADDGITTAYSSFNISIVRPGMNEGQLFSVSPNPFRSTLTITVPEGEVVRVHISNLTGHAFVDTTINASSQFDLSGHPSGIYLLTVSSNQGSVYHQRLSKVD